jgi:aminopeptidase-like protein
MVPSGLVAAVSFDNSLYGRLIEDLLQKLFPICRSITGEGLRSTLKIISDQVPLQLLELPSGTKIFDWEIPPEWNIRDAFIKNVQGERVVDLQASNLHVINYSVPVHRWMTLEELKPHLHSLPSQPNAIPYLTTYYRRDWGFCLTHNQYQNLPDGEYEVCIDATLGPGSLTIAEALLPGESDKEILFSTYCCHPSMANNELSGPIIVTLLYKLLSLIHNRHYSYRFYYGVETIGALAYLFLRGEHLKKKMVGGFVVTCCGDRNQFTYKKVRNPENILDKAVLHALRHSGVDFKVVPFFPSGSDERQYCSPGFDLPIGSIMRSMYGTYPEYHTSLDNLDFVSVETLLETLAVYLNCIYVLENNRFYKNLKPFGEPMLSKYGLYHFIGGQKESSRYSKQLRYILNFSDGQHDLVDIAELMALPVWECESAVNDLMAASLIKKMD